MCATLVVDAFWGDSGKGKIAAFTALKQEAVFCVRAGTGTNAGHSIYFEDGSEIRTHQLCCGWLHPCTQLRIGSGVALDPEIFLREIHRYKLADRARVDMRSPIITPEHRALEARDLHLAGNVGSVCSGSGAARADFVMRRARQARDIPELTDFLADVPREINTACAQGRPIVIESSQGTHLSLALSRDYPCCTSDNCTAVAAADDAGLSWRHIKDVILVVKAVPSRVGAGPLPFEMSSAEQDRRGIREYGVTTGRRRRKARRISWGHLEEAVMLNGPTQIALTFCDHLDPEVRGVRARAALTDPVLKLIHDVEARTGVPVTIAETGKYFGDIVDLS
ncbi:MAG: adenylosuccinate synthetase [Gemmatimonadota bacterium]|nr:adenylosuccinate synthetase [Gemmatimonadota bacterium]